MSDEAVDLVPKTVSGTVLGPDPKLLELLVCPLTKTQLIYDRQAQELISRAAGLAFPIRNGVPLMIEDAARRLDESARKPAEPSST